MSVSWSSEAPWDEEVFKAGQDHIPALSYIKLPFIFKRFYYELKYLKSHLEFIKIRRIWFHKV